MRSLFPLCLLLAVGLAVLFEEVAAAEPDESEEVSPWSEDKRRLLSQAFGKRGKLSQAFGKRGPFSQAFGKRLSYFSEGDVKRSKPFSQAFGKRGIGSLSQGFGKRDFDSADVYSDY